MTTQDLLDQAWNIIANAGEGDWSRESPGWRQAAERFRDEYQGRLKPKPEMLFILDEATGIKPSWDNATCDIKGELSRLVTAWNPAANTEMKFDADTIEKTKERQRYEAELCVPKHLLEGIADGAGYSGRSAAIDSFCARMGVEPVEKPTYTIRGSDPAFEWSEGTEEITVVDGVIVGVRAEPAADEPTVIVGGP